MVNWLNVCVNRQKYRWKLLWIDYLKNVHKYKLNLQFHGEAGCAAVISGSRGQGIFILSSFFSFALPHPKKHLFLPQKRSKEQSKISHAAVELHGVSSSCMWGPLQLKKNMIELKGIILREKYINILNGFCMKNYIN